MLDHDGKVLTDTWIHHPCWGGMTLADTDLDGRYEIYLSDRRDGYHDFPANGLQAFDALTLDPFGTGRIFSTAAQWRSLQMSTRTGTWKLSPRRLPCAGPMILDPVTGDTIVDYSGKVSHAWSPDGL